MSTTLLTNEKAQASRKWVIVDAKDVPLGRLASRVAIVVRGKHRPDFTPHVDSGDFVVIINADKVKLTGKKMSDKMYHWVTGYVGGIKSMSAEKMLAHNPDKAIRLAIRGMLPEGVLGHRLLQKVKIYTGTEHPHTAQRPEPIAAIV